MREASQAPSRSERYAICTPSAPTHIPHCPPHHDPKRETHTRHSLCPLQLGHARPPPSTNAAYHVHAVRLQACDSGCGSDVDQSRGSSRASPAMRRRGPWCLAGAVGSVARPMRQGVGRALPAGANLSSGASQADAHGWLGCSLSSGCARLARLLALKRMRTAGSVARRASSGSGR